MALKEKSCLAEVAFLFGAAAEGFRAPNALVFLVPWAKRVSRKLVVLGLWMCALCLVCVVMLETKPRARVLARLGLHCPTNRVAQALHVIAVHGTLE